MSDLRIGLGTDLHALAPGRRLILGGVDIPHAQGLVGHSDADVLAHAVCDAILGALGLPDMGMRFPAADERNRGRSSLEFIEEVAAEARARGYAVSAIDTVILAEAPRLGPHLEAMRLRLAHATGCAPDRVGVKAKRAEGIGAIGRHAGIMAQAVALLQAVAPVAPGPKRRARGAGAARRGAKRGRKRA